LRGRQTALHKSSVHARTTETALHVYVREPRRGDKYIPALLRPLNNRLQQATEYEMIDVNDFMTGMTNDYRYKYFLKMNEGMTVPIFSYTWSMGGSRAGVNPHVIWRGPLKSEKEQRDQGLMTSQNNIDYLKQNTILFHKRLEQKVLLIWPLWLVRTSTAVERQPKLCTSLSLVYRRARLV